MESTLSATAKARLGVLRAVLTGGGITTRMDAGSLAILDDADTQVDTITVRPWPPNCDALWYFDCTGEAIASVEDVVQAKVTIVGNMQRGRHA